MWNYLGCTFYNRFPWHWKVISELICDMICSFVLLNAVLVFIYYTKFLGVDDEEFGRTELIQEGFMTSFGVFLVSIDYSAINRHNITHSCLLLLHVINYCVNMCRFVGFSHTILFIFNESALNSSQCA